VAGSPSRLVDWTDNYWGEPMLPNGCSWSIPPPEVGSEKIHISPSPQIPCEEPPDGPISYIIYRRQVPPEVCPQEVEYCAVDAVNAWPAANEPFDHDKSLLTGVIPRSSIVFVGHEQQFEALGSGLDSVQWATNPAGTPATGTGDTFTARWTQPGLVDVTATDGTTTVTASADVVLIAGVLTPWDNFAGRSLDRFGVGERVDLSFNATLVP
jgi:hypothetical protein